jgi:hypothetical protein
MAGLTWALPKESQPMGESEWPTRSTERGMIDQAYDQLTPLLP